MNPDADGVAIALPVEYPCKVCGVVKKGDVLITVILPCNGNADPKFKSTNNR